MKKIELGKRTLKDGEEVQWAVLLSEHERHLITSMLGNENKDVLERDMTNFYGRKTAKEIMRLHHELWQALTL